MAGRPILPLFLSPDVREALEQKVASSTGKEAERAQILLLRADGLSQQQTAERLGCSLRRISRWTAKFRAEGMAAFGTALSLSESASSTLPGKRSIEKAPRSSEAKQESKTPASTPTMRTIAQVAGVSISTVSRCLRNHPNIRPEVRKRILQAAEAVDYRPDPELGKLMVHLRGRRVRHLRGIICSLEATTWRHVNNAYYQPLITSARLRAEQLGFAWNITRLDDFLAHPKRIAQIWRNRGVEGILLPPSSPDVHTIRLPVDSIWEDFSVVAATHSVTQPAFRRVVPDHVKNIMATCNALALKGFRRIGLALPTPLEQRVGYHFSAGFSAFHLAANREMLPPLLYHDRNDEMLLQKWYRRVKPDAIIVSSGRVARPTANALGLDFPGSVEFAAVAYPEGLASGIDELPEQVGTIAVDTLSGMIMHREKGIPSHPTTIMVEGVWKETDSSTNRARGHPVSSVPSLS